MLAPGVSFTIGAIWAMRPSLSKEKARAARAERVIREALATKGSPPLAPPPEANASLDIPAELVGPRWKVILERFAPVLGTTPVELLRSALYAGLSGGRPITIEMLDMLDKMLKESQPAPPSKPGPSGPY